MDKFSEDNTIVLASGSARRKEIFESHGLLPVIMPMDVDETLPEGIRPDDAVMYLALKKGLAAEAALSDYNNGIVAASTEYTSSEAALAPKREHALIVSADTIVYARDIYTGEWTIMGKPKDPDDARRMLTSINGTAHKVMTGVALIYNGVGNMDCGYTPKPFKRAFCDVTDVFVQKITDDELSSYIESGEPFGKAGGYAIQLGFGKYIDHIEGDFENVVGFPYDHMVSELAGIGISL